MEKLKLGSSCWLEDDYGDQASLIYTEHSTDYWSGDTETCIDIDKERAVEMIEWLQKKFNTKGTDDQETTRS